MPTLPDTMRFIDLPTYGAPDVMQAKSGPLPVPGEHDVLIRVAVAGVNRPDVAQRLRAPTSRRLAHRLVLGT